MTLRYFDMWGDAGFSRGLEEWSGVVTKWLTSLNDERVCVTFDMIEIREGDRVGFTSALIEYKALATDDTVLRSMRNRITTGFVKQDARWFVIHQHISAPVDAELKAILSF
jgi:ketosteroid isomerase-like protein